MKLKEYAESISKLAEQYPDAVVVYSSDDEGNSYQKVNWNGTMGYYSGGYNGDFFPVEHVEQEPDEECYADCVGKKPNAICIN